MNTTAARAPQVTDTATVTGQRSTSTWTVIAVKSHGVQMIRTVNDKPQVALATYDAQTQTWRIGEHTVTFAPAPAIDFMLDLNEIVYFGDGKSGHIHGIGGEQLCVLSDDPSDEPWTFVWLNDDQIIRTGTFLSGHAPRFDF